MSAEPPVNAVSPAPDASTIHEQMVAMNEGLLLGSIRQHELTETAEELNAQLKLEITERTRAEEALRESEGRFRSLFEAAPMAVFVCDRDSIIQHYNQRAVELWGREPVCGREKHCGSPKLWRPDGALLPQDQSPMVEVLRTGIPARNVEVFIERPDGSRLPALMNFAALRNAQGEITGAIASFIDITERHALEEALTARAADLVRADRSKDEFLAMLAHELRNPLAPLRIAAEILRTDEGEAEERAQAQQVLGRQIENMSHMIDDLLDVSRITEGKIELRRESVALGPILAAAADAARPACAARGQHLTVRQPVETIRLNADATRLEQIFSNLVGNACKYSGDGSHITLTAELDRAGEKEPREVIVRVSDDGAGIDPELLPHVFDLFKQASRTLDRAHGGLGIGLTLVQRLVTLHGGSVEARSEGLGHGSEFIVRLPLPVVSLPPPAAPIVATAQETPCRLLVVDDSKDSANVIAMLLRLRGHETRTAYTGPDALAIAEEFRPDIVLLDIGLPGMDGYEVARRLRSAPTLTGIFLVAMTGYGSDADRDRAFAAGFDRHLVKPLSPDQLWDCLWSRV